LPDLAPFHGILVFAHIIGVFLFLLAHGVSAAVMLRIRNEREPVALRTLLSLSRQSLNVMLIGFLIWFFAGILAGFSGNYWTTGSYWIWASLAIALIVIIAMTPLGRIYLNRVREAVGIDPKTGAIDSAATIDGTALSSAIASGRPLLLASLGLGSVIVLSWLMMFKPF
jgi:lysylphosphatidylglycerol synthetase-like protein (DUF2156 family)